MLESRRLWNTGWPVKPGHDSGVDVTQRSRGATPEFCIYHVPPKIQRAQGKPDAGRTRSLLCKQKTQELVTTGSTGTSGLPCADGVNGCFVLSLECRA